MKRASNHDDRICNMTFSAEQREQLLSNWLFRQV